MLAGSFCPTSITAFWFQSWAARCHPLPRAGDPLQRLRPSLLQRLVTPRLVATLPELPEQALLYLLPLLFPPKLHFLFKCSQSGCLGGLRGGRDRSHKRQISHKLPTTGLGQDGAKRFLQPPWWLGGMPTAPSTQGAENTRFQPDLSCGCNEDNGPYFKELEFIDIWSVLCCQTQFTVTHRPAIWPNSQIVSFHPTMIWS